MKECISREAAIAALTEYNKDLFHIQHALTVEGVMRWYANELGYGEDADFWATVGLLHDIDFEMWPEEHCLKAPELLQKAGCSEEFIHAVCSHGYGLCCDVEPVHQMEKVLFASDELTGLIGAAARMRPSKSCKDMELSSLKKKFKDKKFAAGCSRDVIRTGAERLGWELDELLEKAGCDADLIHAVCSHGYGLCCDVEPVHEMEKVLFASDELTGLIGAAAKMRPSKSCQDMELSSLKKKFKDRKFAAGCSRDVIITGAERLGWDLDKLLQMTLDAMKSCEDDINKAMGF